jgi:hypothetical protein
VTCKRRVAVRLASPEALQRRRGTRPLVRSCGKLGGELSVTTGTNTQHQFGYSMIVFSAAASELIVTSPTSVKRYPST